MSNSAIGRLLGNRGGNVTMMYALVAPVLFFGGRRRSIMAGRRRFTPSSIRRRTRPRSRR